MICNACGAENKTGSAHCAYCGAALETAEYSDLQYAQDSTFGSSDFYPDFRSEEEIANSANDPVPVQIPKKAQQEKGKRRGPSLLVKIPLQLLSLLLSLVLVVFLLATAVLLDCNRMLSAGGIKQLVGAVLSVSQSANPSPNPAVGAVGVGVHMEDPTFPSDVEIPSEVLTDGSTEALVDWICDMVSQSTGQEVTVDREQVQTFVQESTVTDFLAEKVAGYADDFIHETRNTQITAEELQALFSENQALIEETFQVEITPEVKENIDAAIEKSVEENNLNDTIYEQVFTSMEEAIDDSMPGMDSDTLRGYLQLLTSPGVVWGAIGLCVALMLLLCALNFYNLPGGLTWSAVSCILAGTILSLPVAILQSSPALLSDMLALPELVTHLVTSFLSVFALVHYGMLALGVALLLLSIVWRVIRATAHPVAEV